MTFENLKYYDEEKTIITATRQSYLLDGKEAHITAAEFEADQSLAASEQKYTKNSCSVSIPCSPGNADYDRIVAEELTVADYVKVVTWPMVRGKRDALLLGTDWQASSDYTMSDAQKTYRQALRDLPATNSDPTKIVFPDAP